MNPNSYYYTQKQNYIAPLKDNQELLMQRNLYYNDNKGQPSQALYGVMPNSNLLNSQVYQQQQTNLNATQIQNMNLANQQLSIPQDINSNSKFKYVDSLQRMSNDSISYQNMTGNQSSQSISQEWLKINHSINDPVALNRIKNSQPPNKNMPFGNRIDNRMLKMQQQNRASPQEGQSLVNQTRSGPPQNNISARNNENVRTPNFQHVNLQISKQQTEQPGQKYVQNQNKKMTIVIDKRNMYTDKPNSGKLSPTQQNLANSILQYKKKVMEGTAKPDPSYEKYIKHCYSLLSHQEQIEINQYLQNLQKGNNSNDVSISHNTTTNNNNNMNMSSDMEIDNKNNIPQIKQSMIKNEIVNQFNKQEISNNSTNSNKSKSNSNSGRHLTKHDLNSLKYMIDSREKFDDLFYRRFLPAKYKYFSPLQIMGKNIDYYDIYSLLSFVGFEKLDTVGDGIWDHIIKTLHIFPDPPRIRNVLKSHCLPIFKPFNEFILNGFIIPTEAKENTNKTQITIQNQSITPQPQPQQPQSIIQDYMDINQVQSNKIVQHIQKTQPPPQQKLPQQSLYNKPTQQQHTAVDSNRERTNNLVNPIFNNYEPKIKFSDNLKDETLDILDKYVTDPEVKGVEELGLITSHSLQMQLKSGLDTEIAHALNTLSIISSDQYINFSLINDPELVTVMVDMLEDCLKKFKLIENEDDIISFSKLYDMEMDDFEQVYAPSIHGKTLKLEEKVKNRSLCLGNIFRNLSFIPENQELFAEDERLLQAILTTFKIQCDSHYLQDREIIKNNENSTQNKNMISYTFELSPMNNESSIIPEDQLYSETATCILEHRKNGIIFFSNVSAYVKLPNVEFTKTIITILEDVIMNSDDSFYIFPALEAVGKLGIIDKNKEHLFSIPIDWYDIFKYTLTLLPQDGLTLDINPEEIALIEMVMLNLYNICSFDDDLKIKIANHHGFIATMLKFTLYPAEFTNFLICKNENNPQMLMQFDLSFYTNSKCQYYIQTLTPICQRAMRILHEISLIKDNKLLFYPYEAKLVEISMMSANIINKEISQLAGEILSTLQEKDLEFDF